MATLTKSSPKRNPSEKNYVCHFFLVTRQNSYRGCIGEVRELVTISAKSGQKWELDLKIVAVAANRSKIVTLVYSTRHNRVLRLSIVFLSLF